jgi:hypothetical protein
MNTRPRLRSHAARALSAALALALAAPLLLAQGCLFGSSEEGEQGVVRTEKAEVYSSTAMVALKVATLKRGDEVRILKRESVTGPTYTVDWLNVRLKDDEGTSGWVEARHIVPDAVVEKSRQIAGTREEQPAFAVGRLKVNQKLRLGPARSEPAAVVLLRGATFEIIGKQQTSFTPEKKKKEGEEEAAAEEPATATEEPDEKTDTWYQVRLDDPVIKGGWILAGSVSLEAPDEILHLEGDGRRFVGWQVVNTVHDDKLKADRNNYVTVMRRAGLPDAVDYERVYCLFWDPDAHTYYAPYVDSELRGVFPIRQREEDGKKIITLHVLNQANEPTPVDLQVIPSDKGKQMVRRVTGPIKGERLRGR